MVSALGRASMELLIERWQRSVGHWGTSANLWHRNVAHEVTRGSVQQPS
jgi:hypothetical protein